MVEQSNVTLKLIKGVYDHGSTEEFVQRGRTLFVYFIYTLVFILDRRLEEKNTI